MFWNFIRPYNNFIHHLRSPSSNVKMESSATTWSNWYYSGKKGHVNYFSVYSDWRWMWNTSFFYKPGQVKQQNLSLKMYFLYSNRNYFKTSFWPNQLVIRMCESKVWYMMYLLQFTQAKCVPFTVWIFGTFLTVMRKSRNKQPQQQTRTVLKFKSWKVHNLLK